MQVTTDLRSGARRREAAFTLIEIMAVIVIIGLLSALVGLAVFPQIDKARVNTTRQQMKMLDAALETYRMDNAHFPTGDQGLEALVRPPEDARNSPPGGYLREGRVPTDGWGNPYQYESPGQHNTHAYDLWSFGADGTPGGTGVDADLGNWVQGDDITGG
jgi:general secretion pathway protein G